MKKKLNLSYNMPTGGHYRIQYRRHGTFLGPTYFTMRVLEHPACNHPLGVSAHLLDGNQICVSQGREPQTIERAKAIAFQWMYGFEVYRRTGAFPNGAARFNVKEV
jgi:hypothetical protein